MEISSRKCLFCEREIKGRTDKKFCTDQCRNDFNNQQKSISNYNYVRMINNALLKNRKILSEILTEDKALVRAHVDKMKEKGFNFKFITHTYTTKKNATYYYCYEYGYLALENNWFLIVREEHRSPVNEKATN